MCAARCSSHQLSVSMHLVALTTSRFVEFSKSFDSDSDRYFLWNIVFNNEENMCEHTFYQLFPLSVVCWRSAMRECIEWSAHTEKKQKTKQYRIASHRIIAWMDDSRLQSISIWIVCWILRRNMVVWDVFLLVPIEMFHSSFYRYSYIVNRRSTTWVPFHGYLVSHPFHSNPFPSIYIYLTHPFRNFDFSDFFSTFAATHIAHRMSVEK